MQLPDTLNAWTLLTRTCRAALGTWFNTLCLGLLFWILPTSLWILWMVEVGESYPENTLVLIGLGWFAFLCAVTPATVGAIGYGAFQYARGRKVPLREVLQVTFPRFLPILWTGFVVFFLSMFGCVLCIIAGAFAYAVMFLALPAAVVERVSMPNALRRSWALTEGYRLSLGLFSVIPWFLNYALILFLLALQSVETNAVFSTVIDISMAPLLFLTALLVAVAGGVAYHDLRHLREGALGVNLVDVFE